MSIVLYGLTLWGGATDVSRVLLIQKRALRILCGAERLAHCRPLFVRERILTVFSLYVLQTLCRTHANVGELVTRQNFHSHETRGRQRLDEPYQRLSRTRSSYGHLSVRLFNKLPVMARNLPAGKFRRVLGDLLLNNPLYSLREFFMLDSSLKKPCDLPLVITLNEVTYTLRGFLGVCGKTSSITSIGHYVAYVRRGNDTWELYDDTKDSKICVSPSKSVPCQVLVYTV
ncbi:uncharacterized protein LOC120349890 [Nilaparvata lugens]|uniref:uncharacterized protein LOC120349890 n=1 Tax=Nilaparvata lugens TaxID=108931 RepID=UPI00193E8082|nr:uncharacterized protein LOC120349890 [Nilaparvata lugens]